MTGTPNHIDQLRLEVWRMAVGTPEIEHAFHYYDQIRHHIGEATGQHLHRDTIRNFFEGHHRPRPRTLDIYSTFVLGGDEDHPRTFQEFIHSREQESAAPPPRRNTHRLRNALIFLLGAPALLVAGYFLINPSDRSEAIDRSIAVLPFKTIGDQTTQQYFADGISEAIISQLAGLDQLLVISSTSMEQYRQTTKAIPQIAAELNVGYVLEGSVQRSGDQLRITVQLIDGRTDRHRWAKNYDRTAADIFTVQQDIARSVARSLRLEVEPDVRARLQRPPTENLEAYDFYLRGQQELLAATPFEIGKQDRHLPMADSLFRRSLALDPNFALALVGRAKVYRQYRTAANFDRQTPYDSVLIFCDRALELNPDIAEAYVQRAYFFLRNSQQDKAIEDLQQALILNPNHAEAILNLADLYMRVSDYLKAYSLLNKVLLLEHSPESLRSAYLNIFIRLYETGDFEKSEQYLNRFIELDPENAVSPGTRRIQIWFYMITGKFQKALDLSERFLADHEEDYLRTFGELHLQLGNYPEALDYFLREKALLEEKGYRDLDALVFFTPRFGQVLYFNGRQEEGIKLVKKGIAKLLEGNRKFNPAVPNYDLAGYYAFIGDKENALELLRQEKNWLNGTAFFIEHDVQYDKLRDDPEFQEILRRVHEEKRWIREAVDSVGRAEGWVL